MGHACLLDLYSEISSPQLQAGGRGQAVLVAVGQCYSDMTGKTLKTCDFGTSKNNMFNFDKTMFIRALKL